MVESKQNNVIESLRDDDSLQVIHFRAWSIKVCCFDIKHIGSQFEVYDVYYALLNIYA
jgi:hypothetical protein